MATPACERILDVARSHGKTSVSLELLCQDPDTIALLDSHIVEELFYGTSKNADVLKLQKSGSLVLCKIKFKVLAGKLAALAGGGLHGGPLGALIAVLALALQITSRDPVPEDHAKICLLLAAQGSVATNELYQRARTLFSTINRELSREMFEHILGELEAKRIITKSDASICLAEQLVL